VSPKARRGTECARPELSVHAALPPPPIGEIDQPQPHRRCETMPVSISISAAVAGIPSREIRRLIAGPKPWHAANAYAPQAAILFDKFHIIRHLGEALEYARLAGKERRFIKGQKYTLRSRNENSTWRDRHCGLCCEPTSVSTPPTCSRSPLANSGVTSTRVGAALFRELARGAQVAETEALREIRRHDRSPLEWHRRILQTGEQSLAGPRRGAQQQNPCHPMTRLRPARRGIPAAQNTHLHAANALTPQPRFWLKSTHTTSRRPSFFERADRSLRRHDAGEASRAALDRLNPYFDELWIGSRRSAVEGRRSNCPAIAPTLGALPTLRNSSILRTARRGRVCPESQKKSALNVDQHLPRSGNLS